MRIYFILLPILAFFVALIGTVLGSTAEYKFAFHIGMSISIGIFIFWIFLDIKHLKKFFRRKGTKYGASTGSVIFLGLAVIASISVLTHRPRFNKSFDFSNAANNSLSDQSVKLVEKLKEKQQVIEVVAFFRNKTSESSFRDLMSLYLKHGLTINASYYDIQAEPTKALAENITSANTVIFRSNKIEARITIFNEEKITNALIKLMKAEKKSIYFLTGHGEGSLESDEAAGLSFVNRMLVNDQYQVKPISLLDTREIPADASLVIMSGAKYDLRAEETEIVEKYIAAGGSFLAAVDAVTAIPNLNGLLKNFGVEVQNDLILLEPEDIRVKHYGQNNAFITEFDEFHLITKDFSKQAQVDFVMPFTRSIKQVESVKYKVKTELPIKSSDKMIQIKNVESEKDLGEITSNRVESGSFPVLSVTNIETSLADPKSERKSARLIVVGSASFMKNQIIQTSVVSQDLFMNIINYLLQDEEFIAIRPKEKIYSTISLTTSNSQIVLLLLCLVYPLLFLFFGGVVWFRRRNA